jgi:hypothetical protein
MVWTKAHSPETLAGVKILEKIKFMKIQHRKL